MREVKIGLTTLSSREAALRLAEGAIADGWAACAQIDGPIQSVYRWEGAMQRDEEYRVTFKFSPQAQKELEAWLQREHPYEVPQWIVLAAESAGPAYAAWVAEQCGREAG